MIAVGSILSGRYRVEWLIAEGGMASVFAAYDEVLHRGVAIKAHRQGEPVDRQRFERETRLLAGLAHPNLVSVYDAGNEDGDVYIVLELIDGPTLADRFTDGPLAHGEARDMGRDLGAALAYIHDGGIVHRDLKPSNVLFDRDGRARLGDFGIARLADTAALTATATTIGTAAYMAPEQVEGQAATAAADIYALGLVLLESLTGQRSFPGPSHEAALTRLHRDPVIPADLPAPWPALLAAMTARDPSDRPDAAAVAAALAEHARSAPVVAGDAPTDPMAVTTTGPAPTSVMPAASGPGRRRSRPSRTVLAVGGAVLAVCIGAVALALVDDPSPQETPSSTSTTPVTAPATTVPSTRVVPVVDCAALKAEKDALEDRRHEIDEQYRDDHDTRDRLRDEVEARRSEVEELLKDRCD